MVGHVQMGQAWLTVPCRGTGNGQAPQTAWPIGRVGVVQRNPGCSMQKVKLDSRKAKATCLGGVDSEEPHNSLKLVAENLETL